MRRRESEMRVHTHTHTHTTLDKNSVVFCTKNLNSLKKQSDT